MLQGGPPGSFRSNAVYCCYLFVVVPVICGYLFLFRCCWPLFDVIFCCCCCFMCIRDLALFVVVGVSLLLSVVVTLLFVPVCVLLIDF